MPSSLWIPWHRSSPEFLAHYVNSDDAARAVKLGSLDSLRANEDRAGMLKAIYEKLYSLNITYDLEPVNTSGSDQKIRSSREVVSQEHGRGTCLDLAILFAGLCLDAHLLPMLLLLQNLQRGGELHALVVVDARFDYEKWNAPRDWLEDDRQNAWFGGAKKSKHYWDRDREPGSLWRFIRNEKDERIEEYVPVECTGFAATSRDGRSQPKLSFDEARDKAERNLEDMTHVATLDIAGLQQKGYTPYQPPDSGLFKYLLDFPEVQERRWEFVGRKWIFEDLRKFRETATAGYYCIVADAGLGKTALACEIARRYQAPAFFFSSRSGSTDLMECLNHLTADLVDRFSLPYHDVDIPRYNTPNWNFIQKLLREAAEKSKPLMIVLDAIDEAEAPKAANTLLLPEKLPDGVHIVLTSRTEPSIHTRPGVRAPKFIKITDDRPEGWDEHMKDIKTFLRSDAVTAIIRKAVGDDDESMRQVARDLRDKSEGNFMYLSYVLADIEAPDYELGAIELSNLPSGLSGYYHNFWNAMEKSKGKIGGEWKSREEWKEWDEFYRPTIALLCAAREPVTPAWLSRFVGRSPEEIRERVLTSWRGFLRRKQQGERWHIIHKSFSDFMEQQQGEHLHKAHHTIAEHYLPAWSSLDEPPPDPPTAAELIKDKLTEGDIYWLRHLAVHLVRAGRIEALRRIALDYRWLSTKLAHEGIAGVLHDFRLAASADAPVIETVWRALRQSAHILGREWTAWSGKRQLAAQLIGRLQHHEEASIRQLCSDAEDAERRRRVPWLRPLTASLAESDALVRTFPGLTSEKEGPITSVALSGRYQFAVILTYYGSLKLLDLNSGEVKNLRRSYGLGSFAMSEDESSVAVGDRDSIDIIPLQSPHTSRQINIGADLIDIRAIALNRDTIWVASSGGKLAICERETANVTRYELPDVDNYHEPAFGVGAESILFVRREEQGSKIDLWHLPTITRRVQHHVKFTVEKAAVSQDGCSALLESIDSVILYDLRKENNEKYLGRHDKNVRAVAVSRDGRLGLSASDDEVKLWDLEAVHRWKNLIDRHNGTVHFVASASGGRAMSLSYDGCGKVWTIGSPKAIHTFQVETRVPLICEAASPTGALVAVSTRRWIDVWDTAQAKRIRRLESRGLNWLTVGENGDMVAASRERLSIWDRNKDQPRSLAPNTVIRSLAVTPDMSSALVASSPRSLELWNIRMGRLLVTIGTQEKQRMGLDIHNVVAAILPDATIAVVAEGSVMKIWNLSCADIGDQQRMIADMRVKNDGIPSIAICSIKRIVAAASDSGIQLWHIDRGEPMPEIPLESKPIQLAFSDDGQILVSASENGIITVWEVPSGSRLGTLVLNAACRALAISHGPVIIAGDHQGHVHFLALENTSGRVIITSQAQTDRDDSI